MLSDDQGRLASARWHGTVAGAARLTVVETTAYGAVQLLTALHEAAAEFRAFGYEQFLRHPGIRWGACNRVGGAVAPCATVGVVFTLDDAERSEVCLSAAVWFRDDSFLIQADVTVDDRLPFRGGTGNQRFLLDLPDLQTQNLEECVDALRAYTTRLRSYTSVLDELSVPTGNHGPATQTSEGQ